MGVWVFRRKRILFASSDEGAATLNPFFSLVSCWLARSQTDRSTIASCFPAFLSEPRLECLIVEDHFSLIPVKAGGIAGEIRLGDVEIAIAVVIGGGCGRKETQRLALPPIGGLPAAGTLCIPPAWSGRPALPKGEHRRIR